MKILVYGAGSQGSFLAARLHESGQQVSLLARGQRLADLRQHGLVVEDLFTHQRCTYAVRVVDRLAEQDDYDWVIVAMGRHHQLAVLPDLAANQQVANFLFLGNNAGGSLEFCSALGSQRVLLGFLMSLGTLNGPIALAANRFEGRAAPSQIGELDGSLTERLIELAAIWENAGLPVELCPNIDAWLKCHAALILPLAGAYFLAGCDAERISRTRDVLVLMARGWNEAFRVLRAYRIPVLPRFLKLISIIPEPALILLAQRRLGNPLFAYSLLHAPSMRQECSQLGREFSLLAHQAGILTPHLDRLILAARSDCYHLPEGSRNLPLDWRSVWAALALLAGLVGLIYGLARLFQHKSQNS